MGEPMIVSAEHVFIQDDDAIAMRYTLDPDDRVSGKYQGIDVMFRPDTNGNEVEDLTKHLLRPSAGLFIVMYPDTWTQRLLSVAEDQPIYIPVSNNEFNGSFRDYEGVDDQLR